LNTERQAGRKINIPDVAASFQQAVMEVIVKKAIDAAEKLGKDKIVLAGGVAANSSLRTMLESACNQKGVKLFCPSTILCTDNAAMIGCAAYYKFKEGYLDDMSLDAFPNLPLE